MKHLSFTKSALQALFYHIGPRPDFFAEQNPKQRGDLVQRQLEKFAAAMHTDFQVNGVQVENRTLTVKPSSKVNPSLEAHLEVAVSKGKAMFILELVLSYTSKDFKSLLSLQNAGLSSNAPVLEMSATNGPTFRSTFTKFFETIDQKGFYLNKGLT